MDINELIEFYCKYIKRYYDEVDYKYSVGDLVKIPEDYRMDIGYRGSLGIVQGHSGVENHIYVMAYDNKANRYWVCGFDEDKLKTPSILEIWKQKEEIKELTKQFINWTYINNIKLSTSHFKEMLRKYQNSENVFI